MSELLALRKAAAKRQKEKRAAAGSKRVAQKGPKAKAISKPKTTTKRKVNAADLKWKTVNTSTVSAMDGGGGMLMLEELDGVGVEWVEEGGGRRATFVVSVGGVADGRLVAGMLREMRVRVRGRGRARMRRRKRRRTTRTTTTHPSHHSLSSTRRTLTTSTRNRRSTTVSCPRGRGCRSTRL